MATETLLIAQFSWKYTDSDGSEVTFSKGEKFLLLNKATEEWWKVQRISADTSLRSVIYVPATYVEELPTVSSNQTETQEYKSPSSTVNHTYENLDAFSAHVQRSDSNTDSDYSFSDNDTASSLSISPRTLNGSFSPNPQSSTAEIRKSLNLDAVLVSFLLLCVLLRCPAQKRFCWSDLSLRPCPQSHRNNKHFKQYQTVNPFLVNCTFVLLIGQVYVWLDGSINLLFVMFSFVFKAGSRKWNW